MTRDITSTSSVVGSLGARALRWVLGVVLIFCSCSPALSRSSPGSDAPDAQRLEEQNLDHFTDLPVLTHEGREVRFYSDLLKGRRAIISFFYVNCPTVQPALLSLFKLQRELGEKMGDEIVFLTLSVDPERDDLAAVQEYARRYNPGRGWYFITGRRSSMDVINRRLGNTLKLPEGHLRLFLMGNLRTGHWMRLVETAPARALKEGLGSLEEKVF